MEFETKVGKVSRGGSGRTGWFSALALAAWVALVSFALLWPLTSAMDRQLPDDGDALQALWMIAWSHHQATSRPLELFDANLYYPHPNGLAYSEHFLPQGLLAGGLMRLGANLVLAYNLLGLLAMVLIALSVRYWARCLGLDEIAAQVAALIAAVSTFNLEEIARLHVLWMFGIPLGLALVHRLFETGRPRFAWAFGCVFLLQGLSSHYYLISYPLFLAPLVAVYFYLYPERRTWRFLANLALPMACVVLAFLPIELPYIRIFTRYRFHQPLPGGVDLARFFLAPANNVLYGSLTGPWIERTLSASSHFAGYGTVILTAVGIHRLVSGRAGVSGASPLLRAIGLVGAFFLLLACGASIQMFGTEYIPGPYRFFYHYVPFFRFARIPERFTVYTVFVLSLVAGLAASGLVRKIAESPKRPNAWASLAFGALMVVLPLEHWRDIPEPARIPLESELPAVYSWLAKQPGDFAVVELPVYPRQKLRFFGYENYFSTFHWKRIPFGRPSFYPPALEFMLATLQEFPSPQASRLLQSLQIRYVIVHPDRLQNARSVLEQMVRDPIYREVSFTTDSTPRSPRIKELGYGSARVFAVLPEAIAPERTQPQKRIPPDDWTIVTSSESDSRFATDGSLETGWSSESQQQKGQFFEVDLGAEYEVSQISLGFSYPFSEFPRELWINGFHPDHRWRRLEIETDAWRNARIVERLLLDPEAASLDFPLREPKPLTRVRLFIPRTNLREELPHWRIPEIWIYQTASE